MLKSTIQRTISANHGRVTNQHGQRPMASGSDGASQAHNPSPIDTSSRRDAGPSDPSLATPTLPAHPHTKRGKAQIPLPRNRYLSAEGIGYDHSRSSACRVLGIGSTPSWSLRKYAQAPYNDTDQEIRSEHLRRVIERHMAKWERKYPPTSKSAALLPPLPPLGIDGIDAHIAWVTAQQQHTGTVASTWRQGPAHSSSLPPVLPMGSWYIGDHCASSDDPVIPFVSEPLYMCPNIY